MSFSRGGQIGNCNTATHGLHMTGTRVPRRCARIRRSLQALQCQLEAEIKLRHGGEVSLCHAALIQSAVRHEKQCQLSERFLRLKGDELDVTEWSNLLRLVGTATAARDKCLFQLGLDKEFKANAWRTLTDGESAEVHDESGGVPRGVAD